MRSFIFLIVLVHLVVTNCFGQFTPRRWVIGTGSGNPFNNQQIIFNANNTLVQALPGINNIFSITSAAIGNSDSSLLYYTNGCRIYNSQNNIIQNGDSLSPCSYTYYAMSHGMRLPQATVFIPEPGDSNRFYLFHSSADLALPGCPNLSGNGAIDKIYYSLIDRALDNGNGGVVTKNNILLSDTLGFSLIAIKHGNGRDWWIITRQSTNPVWYRWLITDSGILGPYTQSIGPVACGGFWNLKYSKVANKIAGFRVDFVWPQTRYIDLYDFDRCTGLFSNPQTLQMNNVAQALYAGGCEFSPSGRYLYGGAINKLFQFDLLTPNIQASMLVVDSNDILGSQDLWGISQLGANGKIYSKAVTANQSLSLINYPDSAGLACNAVHGGIPLPVFGHYGDLPNIPLYELGPLVGSGCDTITGIAEVNKNKDELLVYPNPVSDILNIYLPIEKQTNVVVEVYNLTGLKLKCYHIENASNTLQIVTSDLAPGLYVVKVNANSNSYYKSAKFQVIK